MQGWVLKTREQKLQMLSKGLANGRWQAGVAFVRLCGETELHGLRFFARRLARVSSALIAACALA